MNPKIVFLTFAMMLSSTMGFAQGSLLKKLGDKAIGAAEKKLGQKVEQSVSRKVGDVLGVSGSESATTASGYAENLLDSNSNSGIFAPDIENSTYTFTTYAGAMSARPDWATDEQMSDRKGLESYMAALADYEKAVNDMCSAYMAQQNALSEQSVQGTGSDARCDSIAVRLSEIYEKQLEGAVAQMTAGVSSLQSLMLGGKAAVDENTLAGALWKLKKQIVASWPKSQECHQVNMLEQKSQGRESRRQQNEIIDRWNKQQLQRWLATVKRFDGKENETAILVAQLDSELESMSAATKKTSSWAGAKSMAATLNGLILNYTSMPHMIFDCPLVSKVWED